MTGEAPQLPAPEAAGDVSPNYKSTELQLHPEGFMQTVQREDSYDGVSSGSNPLDLGKLNETDSPTRNLDIYTEGYTEKKANLERQIASKQKILEDRKLREDNMIAKHRSLYETEPPASVHAGVLTMENSIAATTDVLSFLRPTSESDIAYRLKVMKELPALIEKSTPKDLPLRFHGCPIYKARDIIGSKGISSSFDRFGYDTSYDAAGQISVTMPESVKVTLDSYTGLTDQGCYIPAGCMFVLLPSSVEEAAAGSSMLMGNVDFEEHPDQLYGMVTSLENLDLVRMWAKSAGIDESKVSEFFAFAEKLAKLNTFSETQAAKSDVVGALQ